jgi:hypothetical protein
LVAKRIDANDNRLTAVEWKSGSNMRVIVASIAALTSFFGSASALQTSQPMRSMSVATHVAAERADPSSEADWIVLRFAMPQSGSFRNQSINTAILNALLRNRTSQQPAVRPCQLSVRINDHFPDLDLTVRHPSAAQRLDCLRGAIHYVLEESIDEADFLAARESKVDSTRIWTEPHARYVGLAVGAAERLAYLAIYQKHTPLYEINSVGVKDFTDLSFDEFSLWLRHNREENLITFDAKASLLHQVGLPVRDPMILVPSVSLVSPRVDSGVLGFDGDRFEIPALIMMSMDTDEADHGRRVDGRIQKRFSCNRSVQSRLADDAATAAISTISCFSHWIWGDTWLGLAIRKSDGADYRDFCRQVREFANDADIRALVRNTPERSRGLYVLLPAKCEL